MPAAGYVSAFKNQKPRGCDRGQGIGAYIATLGLVLRSIRVDTRQKCRYRLPQWPAV